MKILVIGAGGREHALTWKLAQCEGVREIHAAPGNPGIAKRIRCHAVAVDDITGLVALAKRERYDLTIVGPEVPLALGLVDEFRRQECGAIFGPTKAAARLESSKSFCKEVMVAAGVPTARAEVATGKEDLLKRLRNWKAPLVLKADGLAAGKGVVVCHSDKDISEGVEYLTAKLGAHEVLIEEFMSGEEVSFIIATNGRDIVELPPSHDYKRVGDADTGPNTGGMGSVCPTARLSLAQREAALSTVCRPMLQEMQRRGTPYTGFLYAGLMLRPDGSIAVLEFNARLGDPETESIMRMVGSNFAHALYTLSTGGAAEQITINPGVAVCVIAAARGYPGDYERGELISGIELAEQIPGIAVFHAGTKLESQGLVTSGGRVLAITATGIDQAAAKRLAYKGLDIIQFRGRHARRDIGN